MTTQVVKLSPALAIRLAAAADRLELSHEDTLKLALRLFLAAEPPPSTRKGKDGRACSRS